MNPRRPFSPRTRGMAKREAVVLIPFGILVLAAVAFTTKLQAGHHPGTSHRSHRIGAWAYAMAESGPVRVAGT